MKKFALLRAGVVSLSLVVPLSTFAANSIQTIGDFSAKLISLINNVFVPLLIAIAFLVFIWGVFKYFISNSEEVKTEGKDLVVYGLIGFFVIVSVWGLVNILIGTFDFSNNVPVLPRAPSP